MSAPTIRIPIRKHPRPLHPILEPLEARTLLSAAATLHPLALLPNEAAISSPKFSDQWHLQNTGQTLSLPVSGPSTGTPGADIHAVKAWDLTTGNNTAVVVVLDTGVDLTHPDLVNNLWRNPGEIANNGKDDDGDGFVDDVFGWNFIDNNNNVQDTSVTNHGTTVDGVIGAQGNNGLGITGVAWNVDMMTLKVGTDAGVATQDLLNAINYVKMLKSRGVNIVAVNASYISFSTPTFQEINAIGSLGDQGIPYVSAAGNASLNLDVLGLPLILPSNMIIVAATDNQDNLASFSSYGKNSVAMGAPGVDILTTLRGGGYAVLSGTSYAAPMVTGAIALMKSLVPSATISQIKSALYAGVDPVASTALTTITGGRLNVYKSLELLLGQQSPLGNAEVLNKDVVSGWAFDFNAGAQPIAVQIAVDNAVVATFYAQAARPDLAAVFGSVNHGFSYALGNLGPGSHTVQVYANDTSASGTVTGAKLIGQGVISNATAPIGSVDVVNAAVIAGWALDTDTPGNAVAVRIDIDGATVATIAADINRPDLQSVFGSANHGYSYSLANLAPGAHQISAFALDTATGAATLLGSRSVDTNVMPWGRLDVARLNRIAGWAFDTNTPNAALQVIYQIDGNAPTELTANVNRPDVAQVFGSGNHGFDVTLPALLDGTHTINVWARDSTTGAPTLIGQVTDTVFTAVPEEHATKGSLDFVDRSGVAGWAFDADASGGVVNVRVDVDGVPGTLVAATLPRPDLAGTLPSSGHGYAIPLSLSAGAHRIDVYAIAVTSLSSGSQTFPVLLGSRAV